MQIICRVVYRSRGIVVWFHIECSATDIQWNGLIMGCCGDGTNWIKIATASNRRLFFYCSSFHFLGTTLIWSANGVICRKREIFYTWQETAHWIQMRVLYGADLPSELDLFAAYYSLSLPAFANVGVRPINLCWTLIYSVHLFTACSRQRKLYSGPCSDSSTWTVSIWMASRYLPGFGECSCSAPIPSSTSSSSWICWSPWWIIHIN